MGLEIVRVDNPGRKVIFKANNIEFAIEASVNPKGKRILKLLSKRKPDAKVHDPDACWIPDWMFNEACRRTAAILFH